MCHELSVLQFRHLTDEPFFQDGNARCYHYNAERDCPRLNCPQSQQVKRQNDCCPVCEEPQEPNDTPVMTDPPTTVTPCDNYACAENEVCMMAPRMEPVCVCKVGFVEKKPGSSCEGESRGGNGGLAGNGVDVHYSPRYPGSPLSLPRSSPPYLPQTWMNVRRGGTSAMRTHAVSTLPVHTRASA